MRRVLVVHYDEIALKGGARGFFEERLITAVKEVMPVGRGAEIGRLYGRLVVRLEGLESAAEFAAPICNLPGVASILEGVEVSDRFEDIQNAVAFLLPDAGVQTFGVRARRGDKTYSRTSEEVGRDIGAFVLERRSWRVDLTRPDLWIHIEIINRRALVGLHRHPGQGGLPVGASGRGVALLSGGIDSPVAAWMMMTRGLRLTLVHFHSAPFTSAASQDKVRDLAKVLARFQPVIRLVMIPFADPVQQAIVAHGDERLRVLLYRRFMMRIAERVAFAARASALITGESLGQVASQTLANIGSVEAAATLPVLRPLVGMGKRQIMDTARRIETYDISIRPHDDCCTFFMPRRPATSSTAIELEAAEGSFDVRDLVRRAYETRTEEVIRLRAPANRTA